MTESEITNRGRWQKGQSGNPKGRPPRKLTETLRALGETDTYAALPNRRLLAQFIWEAVSCGKVQLVGGHKIVLTGKDWALLVKWLYVLLEGPYQPGTEDDEEIAADEQVAQERQPWNRALYRQPLFAPEYLDEGGIPLSALPPSVRAEIERAAELPAPAEDAHLHEPDRLVANVYPSVEPDEHQVICDDPPAQLIRFA